MSAKVLLETKVSKLSGFEAVLGDIYPLILSQAHVDAGDEIIPWVWP